MPFLIVETMALFLLPSLIASPNLMSAPFDAILVALVSLRSMSDRFFLIFSKLAMTLNEGDINKNCSLNIVQVVGDVKIVLEKAEDAGLCTPRSQGRSRTIYLSDI